MVNTQDVMHAALLPALCVLLLWSLVAWHNTRGLKENTPVAPLKTGETAVALIAGSAIVLLLLGGSFRQFFSLAIFAEWLFYMIAGTTVFVFRRRDPQAFRPYRVWGYPVVPILFVLASAVLLYFTFRDNYPNSAIGCLVILAGIPVFYGFARKRAQGA